jgi:DNA helicase-2/ATP-dependent DNA helicase PcrA
MNTLTISQAEAVASEAPITVLIAGPGSGKTKTLIERIIYLLSHNLAVASQMVIITFTNAAAREIEQRLKKEYGYEVQFNYSGTLHGFMLRMLRQHGALIGFKTKLAMLDEEQQKQMLEEVAKDMKIKSPMKDIRTSLAGGPEKFLKGKPEGLFHVGAELIAFEYYRRLMQHGVLDFDSVLQFGALLVKKLRANGTQLPFTHLFWDEFQDSGTADAAIFDFLEVPKKFVVGDPDQSIYGWRGGSPEYLLGLMTREGSKVIYLHENFRCDKHIASRANQLIQQNPNIHCETRSMTGKDGGIWISRRPTAEDEQREIATSIREQPEVHECAILVRSRKLVEEFTKVLQSYGIPVVSKQYSEKPGDWRTARSLLNLFANPDNDLLAYWWIAQQKDTKFANKVKLEALSKCASINRHYLKLPEVRVGDVAAALAQSGIGQESIDLVNKAVVQLPPDATITELSFALGDDELHEKETGGKGVTVSTIHSAKGREWDCVYLPAFEDEIIPKRTKTSSVEEERRIAFVAITRARHKLSVSFAEKRKPQYGGHRPEPTKPSPFVHEIRFRE